MVTPEAQTEAKSERLLNLLIMLLVQRHLVPKARIRAILYPDHSDDAFERKFDRDKEELRSLGVPIEVGAIDALFDDEPGYRVRRDQFALPEIDLDPEEAAVVGLAAKVWDHARFATAASDAVRKLTAAGVDVDTSRLDIVQPRLRADEPSFEVFLEAVRDRVPVRFDYARAGAAPQTRHLQPWGVTRYAGRWYVVGQDTDRSAERVFRLSRVRGRAHTDGDPGSYDVPPGTDLREVARRLAPAPSHERSVLLVRQGAGHTLRRDAVDLEVGVTGPDGRDDWDRLVLTRGTVGLADEVLGHGPAAFVEEPATLREAVVTRLRALPDPVGDLP
ncbi:Protein PafB [Nocardioides aquaticus]|uniref:Protein PafB n=1 Tax=Nocardioides aquaticus TaxID=160826 RepID=A0ABX8EHL5_9ACTN|nr:WYL domain-containing protein [Nocardioides aquaticus]QVT80008.1 Protein PafB [Nocardioides aquaticus]